MNVLRDVLLGLGVTAELVCCLGVLVMRNTFDRLHYAGAATSVGPLLVAAALLTHEGLSGPGVRTIVVVVFMLVTGAVVTSATARMTRLRETGALEALPEERS